MKCDSFQEYLDGYLDGSLSELENEAMRAHMDSCGACKKIYEENNSYKYIIKSIFLYKLEIVALFLIEFG